MASGEGGEQRPAGEQNWWQRAIRCGWGQAVRWLAVLGILLWRWAAGWPSAARGWVPVVAVALLLLLPDADSVAFGGVKLEMRRTREEVADLRQHITMISSQRQNTSINLALPAIRGLATASAFANSTEQDTKDDVPLAEALRQDAGAVGRMDEPGVPGILSGQ